MIPSRQSGSTEFHPCQEHNVQSAHSNDAASDTGSSEYFASGSDDEARYSSDAASLLSPRRELRLDSAYPVNPTAFSPFENFGAPKPTSAAPPAAGLATTSVAQGAAIHPAYRDLSMASPTNTTHATDSSYYSAYSSPSRPLFQNPEDDCQSAAADGSPSRVRDYVGESEEGSRSAPAVMTPNQHDEARAIKRMKVVSFPSQAQGYPPPLTIVPIESRERPKPKLAERNSFFNLRKHFGSAASEREPELRPKSKFLGLRPSLANLKLPQKLKQLVGKKRAREVDEDEPQAQLPVAKAQKREPVPLESPFVHEYRALSEVYHCYMSRRDEDVEPEQQPVQALDDDHHQPAQPRFQDDGALALLEGRAQRSTSPSPSVISRFPNLAWAGGDLAAFRAYVRAANSDSWEMDYVL